LPQRRRHQPIPIRPSTLEGEWEIALPHFKRAIEIAPDDAICQLDFGEYWHSRAGTSEDPAELVKRERKRYVASRKLDGGIPETYAMYGYTFLLEGERPDKALEMLEMAEPLLPSDLSIRLGVAMAYFELDEPEEAIARARSVEILSHPGSDLAKRARELINAQMQASTTPTTDASASAGASN